MYNGQGKGAICVVSRVYGSAGNIEDAPNLLFSLSSAAGEDAETISNSLLEIQKRQILDRPIYKLAEVEASRIADKPLPEKLYDALARVKLLTAQVAMHLDTEWRSRIFEQLDDLLDAEDWHEDDDPIKASSFETFLRMIIFHKPSRRPGFGVSNRGYLIAAWTTGSNRLTIEFLPNDTVRWVLSCEFDGETERAAGETPVRRLMEVLAPYSPPRWFADAPR